MSGSGETHLTMNSVTSAVTVNGGSGDDGLTIKNLLANVTFTGGNSIEIDDRGTLGNDAYTFDAANVIRKGSSGGPIVIANGVERVTLQASDGTTSSPSIPCRSN